MVLKREPTPPGAVSELFDALHDLHLHAGEPGVRDIATGIGRGVMSYTTVHNVFRGPRVPKWSYVELIVEQLAGDVETFRLLWQAARRAELHPLVQLSEAAPAAAAVGEPARSPRPGIADHGEASGQRAMVMVTSRLQRPQPSHPTGVFAALEQMAAARHGAWVGWSPSTAGPGASDPILARRVDITEDDFDAFMAGYCSSTIWPLYHDGIEQPQFRADWQELNKAVNRRFAEAVAAVACPSAMVWIHDYHLQPLPLMLRRRRPDLRIGFFLHITFPPPEIFLRLPDRTDIIRGILGADLVGFQSPRSAHNFLTVAAELLQLQVNAGSVEVDGRRTHVRTFPISVDFEAITEIAADRRIDHRARQLRRDLGNPRILLVGIDRLDYTKGIEQRLQAYGDLLHEERLSPADIMFVQVVTPSREHVQEYSKLRERVERLAGNLNGTFGRAGHQVVHYALQLDSFEELITLYRAADVMVVTPLRDGMNLVAKEFVASRTDNRGVLVLSEFAGAANELDRALLVNPYDLEAMKNAIAQAVAMDTTEQQQRIAAMRNHLREHDIAAWMNAFTAALDAAAAYPARKIRRLQRAAQAPSEVTG
ncbi:MAG TPA: trehalose-6-phosphate synthase [Candidatus Limnocylindrales bacterium]|nr:trehalose-6-phosphate synthase [Candidatus Limnocylindrales bacterium]